MNSTFWTVSSRLSSNNSDSVVEFTNILPIGHKLTCSDPSRVCVDSVSLSPPSDKDFVCCLESDLVEGVFLSCLWFRYLPLPCLSFTTVRAAGHFVGSVKRPVVALLTISKGKGKVALSSRPLLLQLAKQTVTAATFKLVRSLVITCCLFSVI